MSLKATFIARASDGLLLCEASDSMTDNKMESLKQQGRDLLKKLAKPSHRNLNEPIHSTVSVDTYHQFHYSINAFGVIFLTLAELSYPQKLALLYLDDLSKAF